MDRIDSATGADSIITVRIGGAAIIAGVIIRSYSSAVLDIRFSGITGTTPPHIIPTTRPPLIPMIRTVTPITPATDIRFTAITGIPMNPVTPRTNQAATTIPADILEAGISATRS